MGKRAKPTTIISGCMGIAAYFVERGLDMAGVTLSLGWAIVLWVISGFLVLVAVIVGFNAYLWPILRTVRIIRRKEDERSEVITESDKIEKKPQNSNLSIKFSTEDQYTSLHTCSQCGWGFKVLKSGFGNSEITCDKCGNVEPNTHFL